MRCYPDAFSNEDCAMEPREFVIQVRKAIIDENMELYRDLFTGTSIEEAADPYWKKALSLFNSLSPGQKEVFFQVVQQVAVDTTSNVLGVLDGVNSVPGLSEDLLLIYNGQKEPLNGDLQSLFLSEEEKATTC